MAVEHADVNCFCDGVKLVEAYTPEQMSQLWDLQMLWYGTDGSIIRADGSGEFRCMNLANISLEQGPQSIPRDRVTGELLILDVDLHAIRNTAKHYLALRSRGGEECHLRPDDIGPGLLNSIKPRAWLELDRVLTSYVKKRTELIPSNVDPAVVQNYPDKMRELLQGIYQQDQYPSLVEGETIAVADVGRYGLVDNSYAERAKHAVRVLDKFIASYQNDPDIVFLYIDSAELQGYFAAINQQDPQRREKAATLLNDIWRGLFMVTTMMRQRNEILGIPYKHEK